MNKFPSFPDTVVLNGVVDYPAPVAVKPPYAIRVRHEHGVLTGCTWLPPQTTARRHVRKAAVSFFTDGDEADSKSVPVIIDIADDPRIDVFSLFSGQMENTDGAVRRLRALMDALRSAPLRTFMSNVFSKPDVYNCFWTCAASQHHHHARKGGLAEHSLEVAEQILGTPNLEPAMREIGICYGLLHDIGKITVADIYDEPQAALGHELAGLLWLAPELAALRRGWPDGQVAMASLLSGLWKTRGAKPILAVGKLVQAADQLSTENDLRRTGNRRYKPWTPTGWSVSSVTEHEAS